MKNNIERIKQLYIKYKEVINYLIFGGLTAVVSFSSYFISARIIEIDEVISSGISWICAVIFAYITNKLFVFESKTKGVKEFLKEMTTFIFSRFLTGLLCDIVIFAVMVKILNINDIISKLTTQVLVVVLNYIISKILIFKKKNK